MIMDGNGRWAASRGAARLEGHRAGVEALRRIVAHAADRGLAYLTVFGFSTENWLRPTAEVNGLFDLLHRYIDDDLERLAKDGVHIGVIGRRSGLPADVLAAIDRAQARTRDNQGLHLTIALDYGGRDEIVDAVRRIAAGAMRGEIDPETIDAEVVARHLETAHLPAPDLIIRTSGEQRLSNFLLWGAAYAEFLVLETLWPDIEEQQFDDAVAWFSTRSRRFGALAPPEPGGPAESLFRWEQCERARCPHRCANCDHFFPRSAQYARTWPAKQVSIFIKRRC